MRKLITTVLLFSSLLLGMISCQKEQAPEDIYISEKIFLSTYRTPVSFKTNFTAKTDWKAYTRDTWITITSAPEGGEGKYTLTFEAKGMGTQVYYRKGYVYLETANKRYDLVVEQGRQSNTHGQSNM